MNGILSQFRIDDRVALITGGSNGIGKGISLAFAEAGAHIIVADIDQKAGEAVIDQVRSMGRNGLFLKTDVTKLKQVTDMFENIMKEFKRIDILVNNAGGVVFPQQTTSKKTGHQPNSAIINMTDEIWEQHIKLNLTSNFWCSRAAARIMVDQDSGNIINITSVAGSRPGAGVAAYGTTKAAVIYLTKVLALELARFHIRVNGISPLLILHKEGVWDQSSDIEKQKRQRAREGGVVVDKIGTVEDVAAAALYFASDASSYITGEVIDVAGGPLFPADVQARYDASWNL